MEQEKPEVQNGIDAKPESEISIVNKQIENEKC